MEIVKNNKGLIIFYVCIVMFALFMVTNVDNNNDKMMLIKNSQMIKSN